MRQDTLFCVLMCACVCYCVPVCACVLLCVLACVCVCVREFLIIKYDLLLGMRHVLQPRRACVHACVFGRFVYSNDECWCVDPHFCCFEWRQASRRFAAADIDLEALLQLTPIEFNEFCVGLPRNSTASDRESAIGSTGEGGGLYSAGEGRGWQKSLRVRAFEELARRAGVNAGVIQRSLASGRGGGAREGGDGRVGCVGVERGSGTGGEGKGGGDAMECVICLDELRSHVLQPCGHFCVCLSCAEDLSACPICRRSVDSTLLVFL